MNNESIQFILTTAMILLTLGAAFVRQYHVGVVADSVTPEAIAQAVKQLAEPSLLASCRENCKLAAQELTWENEEKVLEQVYHPFF